MCQPFSYSTTSLATSPRSKVMMAWLASLIFSLPVLSAHIEDSSCHLQTSQVPWLVVYLPVSCFLLPLTIITVVYTLIFCTMLEKSKAKEKSREVILECCIINCRG